MRYFVRGTKRWTLILGNGERIEFCKTMYETVTYHQDGTIEMEIVNAEIDSELQKKLKDVVEIERELVTYSSEKDNFAKEKTITEVFCKAAVDCYRTDHALKNATTMTIFAKATN
jgi:hypothetical protein